jgi:taurine transport system permease protein
MIRDAQTYLQSDVVILGLFAIGLSGLLIDGCLRAVERRLLPWRGRG